MKHFRCLIMGANGFIGKHLYTKVSEKVGYENILTLAKGKNIYNYYNFIYCDVTEKSHLDTQLEGISVDYVFYLIANTDTSRDLADYDRIVTANLSGLKNTIEVLKNSNIQRFIFLSSAELYGKNAFECDEDSLPTPISLYSLSKIMSENLIFFCNNQFGFPYTIIRPSLVYGPNQDSRYFIPQAIEKLSSEPFFSMTGGEQTRDFIYIDDLCDALLKIIEQNVLAYETVNISSNQEIQLRELVLLIKTLLDSKSEIVFGAIPYRENEIMRYKINNKKIKTLTNWHPKTTLVEGLKTIIMQQLKNRNIEQ